MRVPQQQPFNRHLAIDARRIVVGVGGLLDTGEGGSLKANRPVAGAEADAGNAAHRVGGAIAICSTGADLGRAAQLTIAGAALTAEGSPLRAVGRRTAFVEIDDQMMAQVVLANLVLLEAE